MLIRPYQPSDTAALAAVYRDAVVGTGAQAYDAQQIRVWSAFPASLEEFQQQLSRGFTLVGVSGGRRVAFGQLDPLDHLALLYTASDVGRCGWATKIYHCLEAQAQAEGIPCLHTEASRIAKHFFLKMGFEVLEPEWVTRNGVGFERFKMVKAMVSDRP